MTPINEKRLIMGAGLSSIPVRFHQETKDIQVGAHYVVMSGYAEITPNPSATIMDLPMQPPSENREWVGQVIIGPVWRDVMECSPVVAPGSFYDSDNDENDSQGWHLNSGCSWDEVEVNGKKRIRLKFVMMQQGETSRFMGVVYHAAATGYVTDMESMNFLT
jgi:hypothetical protein